MKKLLGGLLVVLGGVGIAIAHNIDAIIADPKAAIGIVIAAIGGMVVAHSSGHDAGAAKQAAMTGTENVVPK